MAIDSRNKRSSVLNTGMPFLRGLPLADGTVAKQDRRHTAFGYAGLEAGEVSVWTAVSGASTTWTTVTEETTTWTAV